MPKVQAHSFAQRIVALWSQSGPISSSTNQSHAVSGTAHVLFDGAAAPKNRKETVSTNKRRWVGFLILFGSPISRSEALPREVMLMYHCRVSCTFRAHSAAPRFPISFKDAAGDLRVELHTPMTRSQSFVGCLLHPHPRLHSGSVCLLAGFTFVLLQRQGKEEQQKTCISLHAFQKPFSPFPFQQIEDTSLSFKIKACSYPKFILYFLL